MGPVVRLLGSGIGLAAEAIATRKSPSPSPTPEASRTDIPSAQSSSRKEISSDNPPSYDSPPPYDSLPQQHGSGLGREDQAWPVDQKTSYEDEESDVSEEEGDETDWDLDDAADDMAGTVNSPPVEEPQSAVNEIVHAFLTRHPAPRYAVNRGQLPCPVVIPQRRPQNKSRGFVRAYAPVLADCDIDQVAFMDFLEQLHQASKSSLILDVVNIAAPIAGFAPSASVTSAAVKVAVGVAKEVQSRKRTDDFLGQWNDKFFQPRGLFCLVMTFKPEQKADHEPVDLSRSIAKSMIPAGSAMRQNLRSLQVSNGKSYGEIEMPEAAPLIFPALDEAALSNPKQQNAIQKSSKFVADYLDRRAMATYANDNPYSTLAMGTDSQRGFASRYGDPNHPANSGSLISLVTGGMVNPRGWRQAIRETRAQRQGRPVRHGRAARQKGGIIRRVLKQDILYLMVVNMPSDEELVVAKTQLECRSVPA